MKKRNRLRWATKVIKMREFISSYSIIIKIFINDSLCTAINRNLIFFVFDYCLVITNVTNQSQTTSNIKRQIFLFHCLFVCIDSIWMYCGSGNNENQPFDIDRQIILLIYCLVPCHLSIHKFVCFFLLFLEIENPFSVCTWNPNGSNTWIVTHSSCHTFLSFDGSSIRLFSVRLFYSQCPFFSVLFFFLCLLSQIWVRTLLALWYNIHPFIDCVQTGYRDEFNAI